MKGINSEKDLFLFIQKIITSVSNFQTSTQYFKTQKIKNLCRISFRYYNSKSEIDYLVKCLKSLTKKIKINFFTKISNLQLSFFYYYKKHTLDRVLYQIQVFLIQR